MSKFIITGGNKLKGTIKLTGNKNSALKLIPASLLAETPTSLTNVPIIQDVAVMVELVEKLGARVSGKGTNSLVIDPSGIKSYEPDPTLSIKIRASVVLAAPLLARFGKAVVTPPGGDQIGERLLDTHFSMMRAMGVGVKRENGKYFLKWKKKKANNIFLEEASVTATEMGMMLASSLTETVRLEDAASEPHIKDLADFLVKMGAKIEGAGTGTIQIKGKEKLSGCEHKVSPDYIEGGTFAIASAITGGNITIEDYVPEHYKMILYYLKNMGVEFK
ncbi:MAG: UDP-N-acetylglucosamine 1-carboxyvinyltransferase, partial [Patescibacteria group bacterium]